MESFEVLATKTFTDKDFLQYYVHIWKRNVLARVIDVQTDLAKKEANPDEMVELDGKLMKIGERVEHRKILVQEAVDIYNAAKKLQSLPDLDLAHLYSVEGLKIADDMLPEVKPEEAPAVVEEVAAPEVVAEAPVEVAPVVEEPAQAPVEPVSPEAAV